MTYTGAEPFAGLNVHQIRQIAAAARSLPASYHDGFWRQVEAQLTGSSWTGTQIDDAVQTALAYIGAEPTRPLIFCFGGEVVPILAGVGHLTIALPVLEMAAPATLAGASTLAAQVAMIDRHPAAALAGAGAMTAAASVVSP